MPLLASTVKIGDQSRSGARSSVPNPAMPVRYLYLCGLICLLLLNASCASFYTTQARGRDLDAAISSRDIPTALKLVDNPKMKKGKDRVLYFLDAGMLHYYNGDWKKSNELLQLAEDAIAELTTKSLSKAATSMLLNDNALDYSGEDYEDVYINVFKALNYLNLDDPEAAFVEVRRIDDKLSYLEQKYADMAKDMSSNSKGSSEVKSGSNKFHSSALARYLSLMMYESIGDRDAARIDFDNIRFAFESQAELYPFTMPEIQHPQQRKNQPLLRVIAFANRAPQKTSHEMHIHTSKDMLLIGSVDSEVNVSTIYWPDIEEGYYFKFALPHLEPRLPQVGQVVAVSPDGRRFTLQKLEDVSLVAKHTYEIKEPLILFKSVSRSVIKGLAAEHAKEKASRRNSSLASVLLSIAADAAVFFSENADLRLSQFFPGEARIAELPLSEGIHDIRLEYYSPAGNLIHSQIKSVEVRSDKPNLLQSWYL